MIAEAWAKRRYEAAFVSKINHARDCEYINAPQFAQLDAEWQHIGGMLSRMIERAAEFCRSPQKSKTT
jgi:hypothetical protein